MFVQIAEPSRECVPAYRELRSRVREAADRINLRFGSDGYRPIVLLEAHHEPADVYQFLRAADLCYVGSLHDGMNLVAKEFVSARDDERGVLIFSQFAGAARELTASLMVNPYANRRCCPCAGDRVDHAGARTVEAHARDAIDRRSVQHVPMGRRDAGGCRTRPSPADPSAA